MKIIKLAPTARFAYSDTDSLLFAVDKAELGNLDQLNFGLAFGQLKDELKTQEEIVSYTCLAPKSYSLKYKK